MTPTPEELLPCPIEKIRDAWNRTWHAAVDTRKPGGEALMSIPPRPEVDADFIMDAAIKELAALREEVERLKPFEKAAHYWKGHAEKFQSELSTLRAASEGREVIAAYFLIEDSEGGIHYNTLSRDEISAWRIDSGGILIGPRLILWMDERKSKGYRAVEVLIVRKSEVGG